MKELTVSLNVRMRRDGGARSYIQRGFREGVGRD